MSIRGHSTSGSQASSTNAVLVADDGRLQRAIFSEALTDAGFDVVTAEDLPAALALLEGNPPGVLVVDKNLPDETDGLELLRRASRLAPHSRVIVVSAHSTFESAVEALRHGAFDYLPKPVEPVLLVEKVRRAMASHAEALGRERLLQKYEALFETVPGLVCFLTEEGQFRRVSREGARLLGYDAEELAGQSCDVLFPPDPPASARWALTERRTGQRATRRKEVELVTREGKRRVFEFCSTGVYRRGNSATTGRDLGTLAVGWDITEQRALQEQLRHAQKMEAVGRMAGGIAHDFNNLLTVITANARLLRGELGTTSPHFELVADIEQAGQRATALTRQLLTFSRKSQHQPVPLTATSLLDGVAPLLRRLAGENVELQVGCDAEVPPVMADRGQLEQVLVNLVINARDAMPEGGRIGVHAQGVTLTDERSSAGGVLTPGTYVRLSVSDTGVGMSDNVKEHLFEPFFTTKGPERGTGLGLAVVYGIVQQHHGAVEVRSSEGAGAELSVYLPVTDAREERARPSGSGSYRVGGGSVLVAEDDEAVRRLLRRTLERYGYRVTEAANGEEALLAFERSGSEFDLLVTDVGMPRMTGPALAEQLRARNPGMPVVFVSGYARFSDDTRLHQDRAVFLEKPITPGRLLTAVREMLDTTHATSTRKP
ncbi:MAG: response regulator [Myxococcota bacterium]